MTPPHKKYDFENCLKPETNGNNGDNPAWTMISKYKEMDT